MGFIIPFYIIFATNLLTGGPAQIAVFFAYFRDSQEKNIKRSPNGMKPSERDFRNKRDPEDLDPTSRKQPGGHEVGGCAYPPGRALHPHGAHVAPPTYFFLLYIPTYPQTTIYGAKNLIPPPQPSVPVRSHLGAFSSILPEGALITEGFYINTIASPMMCE